MIELIILFISQLIFSFARTLNVRYTANENVLKSILTSTLIKITWLVSSSLGVKGVLDGDFTLMLVYVISGILGDWLSFKIKINESKG